MGFKVNLQQKLEIDQLATTVAGSMGTPESGRRIDKEAMRRLLACAPCHYQKERDLDLYLLEGESLPGRVLVLDNELPIYDASPEEVALRRSPTVKEMVKIRNIFKILNDKDILVSKKQDSLKSIQAACIASLDLSFTEADIESLAWDGKLALDTRDAAGVQETLRLFAEILGFSPLPRTLSAPDQLALGQWASGPDGTELHGPLVIYHAGRNALKLVVDPPAGSDKEKGEQIMNVVAGAAPASREGNAVFDFLMEEVLRRDKRSVL